MLEWYCKIKLREDAVKKNLFKFLIMMLASVVVALLAIVPMQKGKPNRTDWMKELSDTASLNSLSIPGTHDSGALHSIGDVAGKCQTLPIKNQLEIGVRFLDIRLQLVNNKLKLLHSFVDQMTDFEDVMSDLAEFVRKNDSEFLLVSIKEDADPKGSDKDFAEAVNEILLSYPEVCTDQALPNTVGDARGRIHILARYYGAAVGLPCYYGWYDDTAFELGNVYVQDNYCVSSAEEKIADIRNTYAIAVEQKYALVLNFASCYLESCFPPLYAGLPAHDINKDTAKALANEYANGSLGVVICDFITTDLANAIIRGNF